MPPNMDYYLNPQQVICSSLPELLIGDWGDETTKDHKLRWYYQGQLAEWTDFNLDVDHFFKALKEAFEDCRFVMSDNSPDILLFNPFFPSIEHTQVGAEIDLDGRFKSNVLEKVASVLKIIQYPEFLDKKTALNLPTLPKSMSYGSQKIFNFKDKKAQNSEPDIIFKIPGMGEVGQEVRLLCELKSCSTVSIHGMIEDVRKDPRPPVNRRRSTFRNLIGQAVRDMLAWGIRYGAVSTYNETIFLRLGESTTKPGEYRVYYTRKPLLSSDKVQFDTNGNISVVSTRLAFLYLLHCVGGNNRQDWKLEPDYERVSKKDEWIVEIKVKGRGDQKDVSPQSDPVGRVISRGLARLDLAGGNVKYTPSRKTKGHLRLKSIESTTEDEGSIEADDDDDDEDVAVDSSDEDEEGVRVADFQEDEEDKEEEEDEEDDEDNDSESSGEIVEGDKGDDTYIVL